MLPILSKIESAQKANHSRIVSGPDSFGEFIQVVHCQYSKPMSFEAFTEASRQWTMPEFITNMDNAYIARGAISKIDFESGADFVKWTYHFRNRAAFETWTQEATQNGIFKKDKVASGFEYTFTYRDLDTLEGHHSVFVTKFPVGEFSKSVRVAVGNSGRFVIDGVKKIFANS